MGFKKFIDEVAGGIKNAYDDYQEKKRIEREQEEERLKENVYRKLYGYVFHLYKRGQPVDYSISHHYPCVW